MQTNGAIEKLLRDVEGIIIMLLLTILCELYEIVTTDCQNNRNRQKIIYKFHKHIMQFCMKKGRGKPECRMQAPIYCLLANAFLKHTMHRKMYQELLQQSETL